MYVCFRRYKMSPPKHRPFTPKTMGGRMETLYCLDDLRSLRWVDTSEVRWLTAADYKIFTNHLISCGQRILSQAAWADLIERGIHYCGLFSDGQMVARACIEPRQADVWEVTDVRIIQRMGDRGYAKRVCHFVAEYILVNGRTAIIRTEEDNLPMQRVIAFLGFRELDPVGQTSPDIQSKVE